MNKKYIEDEHLIPPIRVSKAAALGLDLHEKFNKGGTKVGWARAKQLKDRKRVSPEDIKRMSSYFARHEVDKSAENFGNDSNPSKGYIAWLLWGGDAGKEWVDNLKKELLPKE